MRQEWQLQEVRRQGMRMRAVRQAGMPQMWWQIRWLRGLRPWERNVRQMQGRRQPVQGMQRLGLMRCMQGKRRRLSRVSRKREVRPL